MTNTTDRRKILTLIDEAVKNGAHEARAAEAVGLSRRTVERWRDDLTNGRHDARPEAVRPTPENALTEKEKKRILEVCNRPENAALPPGQIIPKLLDEEGIYIASESSFYRILNKAKQSKHRGKARAPKASKPKATHTATAPKQLWAWDITWLASLVTGHFFKCYMILDLYSRKIVAAEVWEEENAEHSKQLIHRAYLSENIAASDGPLILHGDNGSPLKATTVHALMHQLGIEPSHSRPRVSNDNAYAEALFRTVKYHPVIPERGFASLVEAREWIQAFVDWYNNDHRHSAINFVTPAQKHCGKDHAILARRKQILEEAKAQKPGRWINGKVRNCQIVSKVTLNPVNNRDTERKLKKIA